MAAAGVPTAAWTPVDDVDAGMAAIERYPVVLKFDGLAAGKGVVIAEDEAERPRRAARLPRRAALRRRARRGRGAPRRRGALAARAVRRRARGRRWPRRRTTSGSSTATRARTPAAWAPTRPSPGVDAGLVEQIARDRPPAGRRRAAPARHAVPRGPLRRADAHRRRPARARVQRPLRRPRDAGGAAAPAHATCSTCSSARARPAGLRGRRARVGRPLGGHRRPRERRLSRRPRRPAT